MLVLFYRLSFHTQCADLKYFLPQFWVLSELLFSRSKTYLNFQFWVSCYSACSKTFKIKLKSPFVKIVFASLVSINSVYYFNNSFSHWNISIFSGINQSDKVLDRHILWEALVDKLSPRSIKAFVFFHYLNNTQVFSLR